MPCDMKTGRYCFVIDSICFLLYIFVFSTIAFAAGESVIAWGDNEFGQCAVPEPNTDFNAISAGFYHSLGLKTDGSIVAWGYNSYGQCNVPEPNTNFTAIAAGSLHSLGLKQDGSIVVWGDNSHGQCNVPSPNTGFTAIASGGSHSLGLKQDGSIVAWGYNGYGECNVPEPNTGFIAIAVGLSHSLGLKTDGSIVAWGANGYGECNVPSPNADFNAIATGYYHSLGLKTNGSIMAWGANWEGECTVPEPNTGFRAILTGYYHSFGFKTNGSIVAWGKNTYGECNVPRPNTGFTAVAAGGNHSLGLKQSNTDLNNITITKCTVKAGKTQYTGDGDYNDMQDAFTASGTIRSVPADLNAVTHIDVNIISADGNSTFFKTIPFNAASDLKKNKYKHTAKISKGNLTQGAVTSLAIDFNKKSFAATVKNADLTGLYCPLHLVITIGDSVFSGTTGETIVNGPKKSIPTRLMRTYNDKLVVNKVKAKHNTAKASSDTLSVSGDIAVIDPDVNLHNYDVNFTWSTKTFSVPPGNFVAAKTGHIYKCSKVTADANGDSGTVTAQIDLDKATFTVSVAGANGLDASSSSVSFGISFADFNETADVTLATGRSW